jgi:sensory rhodopsin
MVDITTWFQLGAIAMALGTLGLAYGFRLVPRSDWQRYAILVAVPGIATGAYALMALEIGAVETAQGNLIYAMRYLDWLLTTPLHVLYLGLLAGASLSVIYRTMGLMGATIALGFAGGFFASPLKWLLFAAGSLTFVGVVYYAFFDFDAAAQEQDDTTLALFRKLRAFMIVLWLIYPFIWLLAPIGAGLMNISTAVLVISYIDVVAKVGFGLIALSGYLMYATVDDAAPAPAD